MCGIAGYVGPAGERALLRRMTDAIRLRGPDDEGHYVDDHAGIGMRRLSIIDLEGGHQPISNADETKHIVFNGEIYNYKALRKELEDLGKRFKTNSDTEVILLGYEAWGDDVVLHLRGMFAFAIWDSVAKRLFMARDHLGIKPLHYAVIDGTLFFGSEIKAILQHQGYQRKMSYEALHHYLSFLYVPAPLTIFEGIFKLPQAHIAAFQNGRLTTHRFWQVGFPEKPIRDAAQAARLTQESMSDSVRHHMVSDVPVGLYLSGGLDSSYLAALMAKHSDRPIRTFTVAFEDKETNEAPWARKVAEHVGADHREILLKEDALGTLRDIVRMHDEPFGNSTSTIHYLVSKEISRHVKVAMSGSGGDEVFGGYPKYVAMRYAAKYGRFPKPIRRVVELPLKMMQEGRGEKDYVRWGRTFAKAAGMPPADAYHQLTTYQSEVEKANLYGPELQAATRSYNSLATTRRNWARPAPASNDQRLTFSELEGYLPENILTYCDRTSMGASLEARTPYADVQVVSAAAQIDSRLHIQGTNLKAILKSAARTVIPSEIVNRGKKGFNPPIGSWMSPAQGLRNEFLEDGLLKRKGLFNTEGIRKLISDHDGRRRNHGLLLWGLAVFEAWMRQYLDDVSAPRAAPIPRIGRPRRLRILICCPVFFPNFASGGVMRVVYETAQGLAQNHDVTVVTTSMSFSGSWPDEADDRSIWLVQRDGMTIAYFRAQTKPVWARLRVAYTPQLRRWLDSNLRSFDVVHLHDFRTYQNLVVLRQAREWGIPVVLSPHGSGDRSTGRPALKRIFDFRWGRELLRQSSVILALNQEERTTLRALDKEIAPIEIVPNGLAAENFTTHARGPLRERFGWPQSTAVVGYVGRLHERKRVDLLVESFIAALKELPQAKLVIAGADDGALKKIETLAARAPTGSIVILGPVNEQMRKEIIRGCDLLALLSYGEGQPRIVLESLAAETPALCTEGARVSDILAAGGGWSTTPDVEQVTNHLIECLKDPARLRIAGKKGSELMRREYSLETQVERYLAVYHSLAKGST